MNFKNWRDVSSELTMPAGMRHGTAFAIPSHTVRKSPETPKNPEGTQP